MEKSIDYPTNYQDSHMDHMRLNLSNDKKYISLACTDKKNESADIHFVSWRSDNLKTLTLNPTLLANLNKPVHGSIREIRFVGHSFFVMKHYVDNDKDQEDEAKKHKFAVWEFYDTNSGKLVYERNNKFVSS